MMKQKKCTYLHFDEITSTNDFLKSYDDGGKKNMIVVSADGQSAGRGQRGNSWEGESGKNLLFSILIHPCNVRADEQFVLSEAIALSIKLTLDSYTNGIRIKWPNDIYWNNSKIAGILIENKICGTSIERSVLGIGLNVNQETFVSDAPNPVSLKQITGQQNSTDKLLHEIMKHFATFCQNIENGSREAIYDQYFEALYRNHGFHQYADAKGMFEASITHIEPSGIIVLTDSEGQERRYAFKEVKSIIGTSLQL